MSHVIPAIEMDGIHLANCPGCGGEIVYRPVVPLPAAASTEARRCVALTRAGLPCPFHWTYHKVWEREQKKCHIHAKRP